MQALDLTPALREACTDALADVRRKTVRYHHPWEKIARPSQRPPQGEWRIWGIIAGRGFGKTRTESEWAHEKAKAHHGSVGFVGCRTLKDARKTIIGHPTAGILATQRKDNPCRWLEQRGQIRWENGSTADVLTSEEPDSARGPEYAWGVADEVATWKRVVDFEGNTLWDNLQFALRGGSHPQMMAATTPRRGNRAVRYLVTEGMKPDSGVVVTRGSMLENRENLPASFVEFILGRYEGTHLGRQEIEGELLPDVEGAIVTSEMIERDRVGREDVPEFKRLVVGVDPTGGQAEAGIIVVGVGVNDHGYVLEDRSGVFKPEGWARRCVEAYYKHQGDRIVAERNYGGDMVESTIRTVDPIVPVKVVTASRGKHLRFEPVGSLYEQGRIHHVGQFAQLEDEVCCFTAEAYEGDESPNRADAEVFAVTELMLGEPRRRVGVWGT